MKVKVQFGSFCLSLAEVEEILAIFDKVMEIVANSLVACWANSLVACRANSLAA
jgi:hypothetical protein